MTPPPSLAHTPMPFAMAIVEAYQRIHPNINPLLNHARIRPTNLAKPNAKITGEQMEKLSEYAMQAMDDEALGWFSRKLRWGSYGLLCRASITSPNLGVALKRWCRHHLLLTDDIHLSLHIDGNFAELRLSETPSFMAKGATRELCHLTSFRYVLGYSSWLIDSRIALSSVAWAFKKPPHHDFYTRLLGTGIRYDEDYSAIFFAAKYLDLPLQRDEATLTQMLKRALPLTVHNYHKDRLLAERLHHAVREHLQNHPNTPLSAPIMAKMMHLSLRSLHRHLEAEGQSWQSLKNEARLTLAQKLLQQNRHSIKQIARLSGFQHEKSFTRAFHQWMGLSPKAYRQEKRETVSP